MSRLALVAGALFVVASCATNVTLYRHTRHDYWAFESRAGRLPEPNYMPWTTHSEKLPDGTRALVVCRWPDRAFPLQYYVEPPVISNELQDEFNPIDAEVYPSAVERAFSRWEDAVGRPVAFRRVYDAADADVNVKLYAQHHGPGVDVPGRVLGVVRNERDQCVVRGESPTIDRVAIDFAVHEIELFVIDDEGLLAANQVHTVALHEIGHMLGASGQHSPLRGDVMYREADDGRVDALSEHDVNTFRAIYRIPPGAIYARVDEPHSTPMSEIRRGPPRLGPMVTDERNGFTIHFPAGWQTIQSPRGWVAVDGVSWDHDASVQVIALRGTMEQFYERQRFSLEATDRLVESEIRELDGERIARMVVDQDDALELIQVQDWRDGWILLMIADTRARDFPLYRPWFDLVYLSIGRQ